jgi:predicted permease
MRMSHFNVVGDGYFRTIGIPLVRGREFTDVDLRADSAALVAGAGTLVVNETFARRMWPGREAIGKRVSFAGPDGPWSTVVGVARDARYNSLGEDTPTFAYLPYGPGRRNELVLQVRATPGAEASVTAALRGLVAELDPALPPATPVPIARDMATALLPAQIGAALLGAFGTLALLLASVGIYGVMSYAVAQRTHEIGIRTALGASRRAVVALVLGNAARLVGAGLGIGLLLALALSWALRTQLYGVGTGDPLTFLVTPVILACVAALAAWLPARRASRVDPVVALRVE